MTRRRGALVIRADAGTLPLPDESVDLIIGSPPFYRQRSYRDGGVHYTGQIGDEPHPQLYLEACWSVAAELWRVLKPTGSLFWNKGDKRAGSSAPGTTSGLSGQRRPGPPSMFPGAIPDVDEGPIPEDDPLRIGRTTLQGTHPRLRLPQVQGQRAYITGSYGGDAFGRDLGKMLLPHRFAIGCQEGRADPCTRDHEHHGYHPALLPSERCQGQGWIIRQDQVWEKPNGMPESAQDRTTDKHEMWFHMVKAGGYYADLDPLRTAYTSDRPTGRPITGRNLDPRHADATDNTGWKDRPVEGNEKGSAPRSVWNIPTDPLVIPAHLEVDKHTAAFPLEWPRRLILGWSKPGQVVLDAFGGTGTTATAARALDRRAITIDRSMGYSRLSQWRIWDSGHASKVRSRTNNEAHPTLFGAPA